MPLCKLCGCDKPLIRAHIIPRSFYNFSKDGSGLQIITNSEGEFPSRSRIGIYDENILCEDCDNLIGRDLDEYAAVNLLHAPRRTAIEHKGEICGYRYDIDAHKIYRFVASLVWRAHLSSQRFFKDVDLGLYEPVVREIFYDTSFKICSYPGMACHVSEFDKDSIPFLNPHETDFEGVRYVQIYANRFQFLWKLDVRPPHTQFQNITLRDGDVMFSAIRSWNESKERQLIRDVALMPKNRASIERVLKE